MKKKELERAWLFIASVTDDAIATLRCRNLQRWGFVTYVLKFQRRQGSPVRSYIYVKK